MKTSYKLTKALVVVVINVFTFTIAIGSVLPTGSGTSSCSASSLIGGSCSVNCSSPQVATCTGGVLSASCTCSGGGIRIKPSLTSQQLTDANAFVTWSSSYGTSGMTTLSTLSANVIYYYHNGTDQQYTDAELAWNSQLYNLSSSEITDIDAWKAFMGY